MFLLENSIMANKGHGLQKILAGGAAGAVIAGAATYAVTHQKQTGKILGRIADEAEKAISRIDTNKVKKISNEALKHVMHTRTATKTVREVKKAAPITTRKVTKRKAVK